MPTSPTIVDSISGSQLSQIFLNEPPLTGGGPFVGGTPDCSKGYLNLFLGIEDVVLGALWLAFQGDVVFL